MLQQHRHTRKFLPFVSYRAHRVLCKYFLFQNAYTLYAGIVGFLSPFYRERGTEKKPFFFPVPIYCFCITTTTGSIVAEIATSNSETSSSQTEWFPLMPCLLVFLFIPYIHHFTCKESCSRVRAALNSIRYEHHRACTPLTGRNDRIRNIGSGGGSSNSRRINYSLYSQEPRILKVLYIQTNP